MYVRSMVWNFRTALWLVVVVVYQARRTLYEREREREKRPPSPSDYHMCPSSNINVVPVASPALIPSFSALRPFITVYDSARKSRKPTIIQPHSHPPRQSSLHPHRHRHFHSPLRFSSSYTPPPTPRRHRHATPSRHYRRRPPLSVSAGRGKSPNS